MALSPKQLRLVFAKLRAKGLLDYVKKARKHPIPHILKSAKPLKASETKIDVARLLDRLPPSHRRLMHLEGGITVHPSRKSFRQAVQSQGAAGVYNRTTQQIHLYSSPRLAMAAGYSSRPSLDLLATKVKIKEVSTRRGREIVLGHPTARRWKTVENATTAYHEIGHSINYKGMLSNDSRWSRIVRNEWKDIASSEQAESVSLWGYPPVQAIKPQEAWSEAYAMYARSKSSRNKLRKTRPITYEYMHSFFSES